MADSIVAKMDEDQPMTDEHMGKNVSKPGGNRPDLREMSIVLDGWSKTCDTVLNSLNCQINKIAKNSGKI